MERLEYVDVFRGVAILDMIILQIFDVLSKLNIYSDPPFYYAPLNWTSFPPPLLFTFVAGMSVFLLTEKLQQNKESAPFKVVKRYGFYVLISLPFTWFMWNLATYLSWNEAIQGIGLTAVFLSLILMAKPRNRDLLVMTLVFSGLQAALFYLTRGNSYGMATDVFLNALVRGWFSVANLLPLMLGGVLFFKLIRAEKLKSALILALGFTIAGILLHLAGLKIDYYGRSFAFSIFAVGLAALVVLAVYAAWSKYRINWRPAAVLGQASFAIYIGHYLFMVKPLRLLGLADKLGDWISLALTIVLVIAIYFVVEYYLKLKTKFKK